MTIDISADNFDAENLTASGDNVATVASVSRAVRILRCFSAAEPVLGVSEIARKLNMHKSTTYRLLVTLEREQLLYQVEAGRYALSYTLVELAAAVASTGGVRELVLDALRSVVGETGETTHLAVLDAGAVLYMEKVEGTWSLRMPSAVGKRVPLNCTALGKVLLAGLDRQEAERIVRSREWTAATEHSVTDPDKLLAVVEQVRRDGYAVDHQEIEIGLLCIAAPILDDTGKTCAGISISAPVGRVEPQLERYIEIVKRAAAELSKRLGPRARALSNAVPGTL